MDAFINELMGKMTLEEKIGQLNLVTAGEATTGSVVSSNVENNIKAGKIGGIFSMSSPEKIRKAQELAIKHSRLKIPIIFGMDVIHGYKTVFPIPLGLAATWDMVIGYQGDDLSKYNTLMACVKHFALYGAAEAGRDYHSTDMSLHRRSNLSPRH